MRAVREDYLSNTYFFNFNNCRYIDCLSLTYVSNKNKILKLHYKDYKNIQNLYKIPNN